MNVNSPPPAIVAEDLHRVFANGLHAVRGLSFSVQPGSVTGFIGANGAGKTTTMRMLVTLDEPTSGRVSINGKDARKSPTETRRRIGWMPDHFGPYENMTVLEYLDLFGRAFQLPLALRRERLDEVMAFTDLDGIADRHCDTLSKGMAQRLSLARTLVPDPDILVLDEPAAGLDPKARIEFKNLVGLLAQQGKTLFISSHILSELGEMCDWLIFIDKGRILHEGDTEEFQNAQQAQRVRIRAPGQEERLRACLATSPRAKPLEETRRHHIVELHEAGDDALCALLEDLHRDGIRVAEFTPVEDKLEDAFVRLLRGEDELARGTGELI